MSVVVYYCERCGQRIEIDEIEQGLVATATNGYYCQKCAQELGLPLVAETKKSATASNSKRQSKITTYKIRKQAVDEYELYGLDKKVAVPRQPHPSQKKRFALPIVLGVIGVVVAIVIVAAVVSSGPSERAKPDRRRISKTEKVHHPPTPDKAPKTTSPAKAKPKPHIVPEWKLKLKEVLRFWNKNRDKLEAYPEICRKLRDLLNTPRLAPDAYYQIQNYYDNAWVQWRSISSKLYKDLRTKEAQCSNLKEKLSVWEREIPAQTHPEVKEAIEQRRGLIKNALSAVSDLEDIKKRTEEALRRDSNDVSELGGIIIDLEMLASEVSDWIDEAKQDESDDPEVKGLAELLMPYISEAKELQERLENRADELRKKRDELEKAAEKRQKPPDKRQKPPQQNQPPWTNWNAFKQRYGGFWRQHIAPKNSPELTVGQLPPQIPLFVAGAIQKQGNTYTANQNGIGWILFAFKNGYEFRNYTATLKMKITNLGGGVALLPRGLLLPTSRSGQLSAYGQGIAFPKQVVGKELTIKVTVSEQDVIVVANNSAPQKFKLRDSSLPLSQNPNPPAGVPILLLRDGASVQIINISFQLNAMKQ